MTSQKQQRLAEKPEPRPSVTSGPFWAGCAQDRLLLPNCRKCQRFHFYPRPRCPFCGHGEFDWIHVSGRGRVRAATTVHRSFWGDAWADDVPYNVSLITLDEGIQLVSNVIRLDPAKVTAGMAVAVTFEQRGDTRLPVFHPDPRP